MRIDSLSTAPPVRVTRLTSVTPTPPQSSDETEDGDSHIGLYSVQDAAFIRHVSNALMQACVLQRWDPESDPDMEDVLPPSIVGALHLTPEDRHAIGMTDAILALTDLRERRRVLIQVILAHRVLR